MNDRLRIGDADREEAVRLLGEHYAQGRLDKDEFDERSDAAWTARTHADLKPLFADLPLRPVRPRVARPPALARPPRRRRIPLVPIFLFLLVLGILTDVPFVLIGLLVWFGWMIVRPRGGCGTQSRGSRRADLGSWS